ncbi:TonB-dependent receptor [Blastomonas aquatica]|uniref:TonB-dependent receptor n=1 Tax=Blastomonas aquatica TaxID=1510276 RepID=A0ABQ1JG29_9SPHN|nr:TonB-dependent receptor [Blastomonas aquatica]GGB68084.1 TonB-dependent receptor [Blastomonas aquatica]
MITAYRAARSVSYRSLALALALGAASFASPAIAGEVTGTVTDIDATRALQAVDVRIIELNRTATTSRDGTFRFTDIPAGTYTLEARYVGAPLFTTSISVDETGVIAVPVRLGVADGNDILVVGQAANQASALSRQRAADGVSSVLTRDAIGQFPDQNVAESLRRLPGLNILNDQGEGRFVAVRGLDPNLNSTSINGVRVPSPDGDNRSVALDVISSDIIESIEVKKSLTPDMDGDTIGASIEINTTSAFDRKKDLFSVKAEGSYNDLANTLTPRLSLDFSKKIGDDFGVAGGISYYQRKFASDNIETGGWGTSDDGIDFADEVDFRDYDVERKRISATLNFDARLSDATKLYLRGLYSQFDDQEFRRRLVFVFDEAPTSGTANTALFDDADGRIEVRRDNKDRFESQKIRTISLGGETETGPWKFTYSGSWAKSGEREDGSIDPVRFRSRFEDDGLSVNFNYADDMIPRYAIPTGRGAFTNPALYEFNRAEISSLFDAQDEEFTLRADLAHRFGLASGEFTVQAGAKSRWREKFLNYNLDFYDGFDGPDLLLSDFVGPQTYGLADISPAVDKRLFSRFFRDNIGQFELNSLESSFGSSVEDFIVNEDVLAGYLMGRYDSADLRIIGGVRVERTKNDIRASLVELVEEGAIRGGVELDEDTVFVTPNRFERNYTNWLPSLTVRYEPAPNVVLRAGGFRSLVRPNLADLAPRFVVEENDGNERQGEFGNPALQPYKAWNLDLSAEYYFSRNGAISGGFFYKNIEDFIVSATFNNPATDPFGGVINGIAYDEASIPLNGESATIKGFEFSYQQVLDFLPSPLDGILVNVNYTYTDAKSTLFDGREITLPAASKNTFNLVLGYEKGPISLRAAGTYRDRYLDEIGGAADEDRIVDEHFQIDLSGRVEVLPGVRVFAEAINIGDRPYFAYQNLNNRRRLLQYEEYSFTLKFGISAAF